MRWRLVLAVLPSLGLASLLTAALVPGLSAAVVATPALARDNGQFGNVPPEIRAWFKSVKSHAGVPCCDIADGHRTDYDMRQSRYWVPINGEWMMVPPEAVVDDAGNPTGDAVVWYSESRVPSISVASFPAAAPDRRLLFSCVLAPLGLCFAHGFVRCVHSLAVAKNFCRSENFRSENFRSENFIEFSPIKF
jgi:hypothetical protein